MKRFKYRLERVLHFRRLVEAEAKRELQMAQRALAEAEAVLQRLEQELVKDFGGADEHGAVRFEEFLLANSYRVGLRVRIAAQQAQIELRRAEVVEKLARYREAAKELESLQRHRVGKAAEYEYEVSLAEQAQIDELMVQRHSRNHSRTNGRSGNRSNDRKQ